MVSWLMTIKAVLISSGVATVGLLLKVYVPMAVDFSVSQAPVLWSSLLSWLKPPYLYVITNGIIITIVASSKYYRNSSHHHEHEDDDGVVYGDYKIQTEPIVHASATPRMLEVEDLDPDAQFSFVAANPLSPELETEAVMAVVYNKDEEEVEEDESELKSVVMVENSNRNHLPLRMTESENLPPMNSRLAQASTKGGRARLRVTKPKRNHTLEDTWKMITEGKSTRLPRQLYRRSDTFSRGNSGEANPVYRKSETFRDRTNYYQSQLRKEPSLSQDDLNRRVEAFIKQFNEDMKLQRMESLSETL
ncbi:Cotton fiber [Hirschfeldia incana]|nr:Cotton fiber [Hirschfeldia incana]